jgi:hypothetical protein
MLKLENLFRINNYSKNQLKSKIMMNIISSAAHKIFLIIESGFEASTELGVWHGRPVERHN